MKTTEIIKQKYPEDFATGNKEDDLRGLWELLFYKIRFQVIKPESVQF